MRNYGEKMQQFLGSIDEMMALKDVVTPEFMENIKDVKSMLGSFDIEDAKEVSAAATVLSAYSTEIQTVQNGLPEIKRVVEMQNQVHFVSDARQNIGLVAGSIEDVKALAEYKHVMGAAVAMQPMIDEMLAMSVKMDAVLDMEEDIDTLIKTSYRMSVVLDEVKEVKDEALSFLEQSKLIELRIIRKEKLIDEKFKKIQGMVDDMQGFSVDVRFSEHSSPANTSYNAEENRLTLIVPAGKPGPKGDDGEPGDRGPDGAAVHRGLPGKDGKTGKQGRDFSVNAMGPKVQLKRYANRPVGFSFLSLDESPTMIYFRQSNALDDWTDGQPFGSSDGGYAKRSQDTERFSGMTLAELTAYIKTKIGV